MPPLTTEKEMDEMSSGNKSDSEPMSTKMLEDIQDGSKSHPSVDRRDTHKRIHDRIKKVKWNEKERYYLQETWAKVYTKYLRL